MTLSSSSPYEAMIPALPPCPDDPKAFQVFLKRVAESLHIPLDKVLEGPDKRPGTLHCSVLSGVALSINEAILEPAGTLQQTPTRFAPISKWAEKRELFCIHERVRVPTLSPISQIFGRVSGH